MLKNTARKAGRTIAATLLCGLMAACSSIPLISGTDSANGDSRSAAGPAIPAAPEPNSQQADATPPPPPSGIPERALVGRSAGEIDELLGRPAFVSRQGHGELRRYTNNTCNLLVLLYPDNQGTRTARTIDSTSFYSTSAKPDIQSCLNGF